MDLTAQSQSATPTTTTDQDGHDTYTAPSITHDSEVEVTPVESAARIALAPVSTNDSNPTATILPPNHTNESDHQPQADENDGAAYKHRRKSTAVSKKAASASVGAGRGGGGGGGASGGASNRKKRPTHTNTNHDGGDAPKRMKRDDAPSLPHGDAAVVDPPSSVSNDLTPAQLSVLADLLWTPRFLHTVLTHLTQSRTVTPNWHVVAALFRQKLVEGGWSKVQRFMVKQVGTSQKEVLVRSRRFPVEFTPTVCERLYNILLARDRGDRAATELQRAMDAHKEYEKVARELPFYSGGRPATLPCPIEEVELEFTGGLPAGARSVVSLDVGVAAPHDVAPPDSSSSAPAKPDSLVAVDDVDDDLLAFMDAWPGLSQTDAFEVMWTGGAIRRWSRGHQVELQSGMSNKLQLFDQLSHLHHTHRRMVTDRAIMVSRKPWMRNGLLVDLSTGHWIDPTPILPQHVAARHATWESSDDLNVLDAVFQWLRSQPPPTPDTFLSSGVRGSSALLPRTLEDWSNVRRMCQGFVFPCSFFRRRWWLLCQEATEAPVDIQQAAAAEPLPSEIQDLPLTLTLTLKLVVQKVNLVTAEITKRMSTFLHQYGEPPEPRIYAIQEAQEARRAQKEAALAAAQAAAEAQAPPTPTPQAPAQMVSLQGEMQPTFVSRPTEFGTPLAGTYQTTATDAAHAHTMPIAHQPPQQMELHM